MLRNKLEEISGRQALLDAIDGLEKKIEEIRVENRLLKFELEDEFRKVREYVSLEIATLDPGSKILIMGFYGARNVGDELMLKTLLDYFNEKNIRVTIMLADNYMLDVSLYAPHNIIHYPKKPDDIAIIAQKFDTVIWGGGATLDDNEYYYNGDKTTLSYSVMAISKAVIKKHGEVIIFGVSANEILNNQKFISDLKFIIKGSKYFSLRDTNSLKVLELAGIEKEKIEIIDDLALAQLKNIVEIDNKKKKIVIGLVYILNEGIVELLSKYTRKIIEYLNNNLKNGIKAEILMVPFYDYQNNDYVMYEKLRGFLSDIKINDNIVLKLNDNLEDPLGAIEVLSHCDVVFAMRYHALLLASCVGARVVSIDYSSKHRHYRNKISYVREKYSPEILNFDFGDSPEKFRQIVEDVFKTKIDKQKKKQQAEVIINELEKTLKKVLG